MSARNSLNLFAESISIFTRNNDPDAGWAFHAEHDQLFGPELPPEDSDDGRRLVELNWFRDEDCWSLFT